MQTLSTVLVPQATRRRDSWHAFGMTGELFMTPTDVAEVLGCSVETVQNLIDVGEIVAVKRRGWKIEHSEVARIVMEFRRTALELGEQAPATSSFVMSRPIDGNEFH